MGSSSGLAGTSLWPPGNHSGTTFKSFESPAPPWFVSMGETTQAEILSHTSPTVSNQSAEDTAGSSDESKEDKDSCSQQHTSQLLSTTTPKVGSSPVLSSQGDVSAEPDMTWLKIVEEDSAVTIQTIGLGSSFVTLGAGLDVRSIKCGFDTCLVEMKNLPLETPLKDVEGMLSQQGVLRRTFRILSTQQYGDGSLRVALLAHKDTAQQLAAKLDGTEFGSKTIEFNVIGHNSVFSAQSTMPNVLSVSWEAPDMVAVLTYRDPRIAHKFAKHLNKEGFGGHKLSAYVVAAQEGSQIKTTAIPTGLNCFQLHTFSKAQSILIQPAFDNQDLINSIQQFLGLDDTVQAFFRTATCTGKTFGILNIAFDSWVSAKRACELLSGQRTKPEYPVLRCYLPFRRPIQAATYIPLEPSFAHVWDSLPEQLRKEGPIARMHSGYGCIPPVDENVADTTLRVSLEKLSLSEEKQLSHWHWARSSIPFLHLLQTRLCISLIEICWVTRTLKIFAEDQATLARAVRLIRVAISRSSLVQQIISVDRRLIRSLQATGVLGMLKQNFGVDGVVSLDTTPSQCMLKYHRMPSAAAHSFLSQQQDYVEAHGLAAEDDEINTPCPICLDDFSDPDSAVQRLTCGHVYCTECLRQFLVTAPERNKFPLACIGNEDRCKLTIPIPLIQSLLSPQQFDALVEKALNAYIEQRPDQYKYCPSVSCGQLYRSTPDTRKPGTVLTSFCPSCAVHLCTACHKPAHSGLTCAERRERDPSEHDALNTEWASSNGAKRCPACQVWIQKMEGCNHVTCRCGAHICWICGASFEGARETYRHLRATHEQEPLFYQVPVARRVWGVREGGIMFMPVPPGQQGYPRPPFPGDNRINPIFYVPPMPPMPPVPMRNGNP